MWVWGSDPLIRGVAQRSLKCTIRKRFGGTEGHEDQWRFLAGQLKSATESRRGDVSSIWSRLRAFAGETGVRLHGGTSDDPMPTGISIGDRVLSGGFRRVLLRELRTERGKTWLSKWASLAEQGGFARTISQASESNYWLRDCRYLRYREYRWAIKARLNLLPVAAHRRKFGGSVADTRCKGCTGNIETQEHCLNVCQANMPAIKARHDRVMERLVGAIPDSLGSPQPTPDGADIPTEALSCTFQLTCQKPPLIFVPFCPTKPLTDGALKRVLCYPPNQRIRRSKHLDCVSNHHVSNLIDDTTQTKTNHRGYSWLFHSWEQLN